MPKNPLLSRKWWIAVLTIIGPPLARYAHIQVDTAMLVSIVLPAVAYILTEGSIDRARVMGFDPQDFGEPLAPAEQSAITPTPWKDPNSDYPKSGMKVGI